MNPKRDWTKDLHLNKGALHEQLGIPEGQDIPQDVLADAAKQPGMLGKRARFAMTLKGFSKPKSADDIKHVAYYKKLQAG